MSISSSGFHVAKVKMNGAPSPENLKTLRLDRSSKIFGSRVSLQQIQQLYCPVVALMSFCVCQVSASHPNGIPILMVGISAPMAPQMSSCV